MSAPTAGPADAAPASLVGLTFDDGPHPAWTPGILRALADARAGATFFVMSTRAARHPELIAAAVDQGHEVGLHCARHLRHTHTARALIEQDTSEALGVLASLGVRPRRWRVPWGACAAWTGSVARDNGLSIVGWSADTHDWRGDSAQTMLEAIDPRIVGGAVVLMHDGLGPGARRDGCGETVRLVGPLATAIRTRGCEPASLASMEIGASC